MGWNIVNEIKHYYAESERITSLIGRGNFSTLATPVTDTATANRKVRLADSLVLALNPAITDTVAQLSYLTTLTNRQKDTCEAYWYHPDHLGSASWITNIYGRTIQHLYYLPWGEDFVNQRTGSFSSMYTFSAKEKDTETGYSYFGARYYSSDLSIGLSVDPMSDKYPSLSPYVYCADNPVKLVDPNGMEYGKKPVSRKRAKATVSEIKKSAIEANREINHNSTWNIQGEYRYTGQGKKTDTRSTSAKEFNMYVNYDLVFYVDESNANSYENYELYVVTCMLVHFVSGTGPENYDFPENGRISKAMAKSSVVKQAIKAYKKDGKTDLNNIHLDFGNCFVILL